jgi:hypothetical protein
MANFENKILKKKRLDKESHLKISQNEMSGRIFVEFSSENGKLVLQKSFQNTYEGNKEAQAFSKTIKNIDQLRKHFGLAPVRTLDAQGLEIVATFTRGPQTIAIAREKTDDKKRSKKTVRR